MHTLQFSIHEKILADVRRHLLNTNNIPFVHTEVGTHNDAY